MSGVSLPVTRPVGRGLIVGSPQSRIAPLATLQRLGFACAELDDPYAALVELCRRPQQYTSLILALNSLYREELQIIPTIKRRCPQVEIWVTQTDGRQAALAEAMRLGADGLLADDGLHRIGTAVAATPQAEEPTTHADGQANAQSAEQANDHRNESDLSSPEPVLTAEELRALLQEQPSSPFTES